jgi:hypothetical protein
MRESGQATVEWIALLAVVGLALGALASGVSGAVGGGARVSSAHEARSLGNALAERITCAARDACGAARGPALRFPPRVKSGAGTPAAGPKEIPGLRRLTKVVKHGWIVCFGVRSLQYDLAHPRSPREAMPPEDALEIVNDCLNPLALLPG